jgi:hypothetical protein
MTRPSQEDRDTSYRRGWTDSLRGYSAMYDNQGPSPYDYGQGWRECARERWRDPSRRGVMPEGAPVPQSQAEYRAPLQLDANACPWAEGPARTETLDEQLNTSPERVSKTAEIEHDPPTPSSTGGKG